MNSRRNLLIQLDPVSGAHASLALELLRFLASVMDMRDKTKCDHHLKDLVIAFAQAQPSGDAIPGGRRFTD